MTEEIIPAVLCLSGLDPTGGAGLQADIEALAAMGVHACPVATVLTAQDTNTVHRLMPVAAEDIVAQAEAVLQDIPMAAAKVGLLGSASAAEAVAQVLAGQAELPLVVDPVLASGDGTPLSDEAVKTAIRRHILPLTTLLTPNAEELAALAPEAEGVDAQAQALMAQGARFVLVTGAERREREVVNVLYGNGQRLEEFVWPLLPHEYHGSGCTLAAAVAGLLAFGLEPYSAVAEAQEFTWEALAHAQRMGIGRQYLPNRFFWAREEDGT